MSKGKLGLGAAQPGLGLSDVGAGEIASGEQPGCRPKVFGKNSGLVFVQVVDGPIPHDVHVGFHNLSKDVPLDSPEGCASGLDPRLGCFHRVANPPAGKQRQVQVQPARHNGPLRTACDKHARPREVAIDTEGSGNLGPSLSAGERYSRISALKRLTLGIQDWTGSVGGGQRIAQGVRGSGPTNGGIDQHASGKEPVKHSSRPPR